MNQRKKFLWMYVIIFHVMKAKLLDLNFPKLKRNSYVRAIECAIYHYHGNHNIIFKFVSTEHVSIIILKHIYMSHRLQFPLSVGVQKQLLKWFSEPCSSLLGIKLCHW